MIPLQLRAMAVVLGFLIIVFNIRLIYKGSAEFRHLRKWFGLSIVLFFAGSIPIVSDTLAQLLGIESSSFFWVYIFIIILFSITSRLQVALIRSEFHIKILTQELALLKKKVEDLEKTREEEDRDI